MDVVIKKVWMCCNELSFICVPKKKSLDVRYDNSTTSVEASLLLQTDSQALKKCSIIYKIGRLCQNTSTMGEQPVANRLYKSCMCMCSKVKFQGGRRKGFM